MKRSMIAALLVMALGGVMPAHAADQVYASGPGETVKGYAVPAIAYRAGDTITYYNFDIALHDVVADDDGGPLGWCIEARVATTPTGCPLFGSQVIGNSARLNGAPVGSAILGLNRVVPGEVYGFHCSVHPNTMTGSLVVSPA